MCHTDSTFQDFFEVVIAKFKGNTIYKSKEIVMVYVYNAEIDR